MHDETAASYHSREKASSLAQPVTPPPHPIDHRSPELPRRKPHRRRRCRCCCLVCSGILFLAAVSFLILLLVMGAMLSHLTPETIDHAKENPWPSVSEDGYYQSYQTNGRWSNFWSRNAPANPFLIFLAFQRDADESGVTAFWNQSNRTLADLDRDLPVTRPYWLKASKQSDLVVRNIGEPGVRATWLGHATVLAEVDGHVVLCDPVFSERAFMVQFVGPKRYRPAACTVDELPNRLDSVVILWGRKLQGCVTHVYVYISAVLPARASRNCFL